MGDAMWCGLARAVLRLDPTFPELQTMIFLLKLALVPARGGGNTATCCLPVLGFMVAFRYQHGSVDADPN